MTKANSSRGFVWERPEGNDAARGRALALCLCLSDNGFGVTQVLRMACGDWFNRWLPCPSVA
jgi:hypothetical protein